MLRAAAPAALLLALVATAAASCRDSTAPPSVPVYEYRGMDGGTGPAVIGSDGVNETLLQHEVLRFYADGVGTRAWYYAQRPVGSTEVVLPTHDMGQETFHHSGLRLPRIVMRVSGGFPSEPTVPPDTARIVDGGLEVVTHRYDVRRVVHYDFVGRAEVPAP